MHAPKPTADNGLDRIAVFPPLVGEQWEIALTVVGVSTVLLALLRNMTAAHEHA